MADLIAVASDKRLAQLPDVPTFKEQGYPAMTTSAWYSVFVQAKVITDPAVKERMVGAGGEPWTGSLSDFDAFITQDARALGEDGKRSGYKLPQ
jgi:tripartite-type tricarboxylate transporter receptor subunit TctC